MILHNLSSLFGRTFETVQDLNRFRKSLAVAPLPAQAYARLAQATGMLSAGPRYHPPHVDRADDRRRAGGRAARFYAALALAAAHAAGTPAWLLVAGAPALYLGVLALFVASYFVLAWVFRARRPPDVRIGFVATLRLVWLEYWTLAGAAPRMLLYRVLVPEPPPAPAALPVVLVHGVLCNAGVWARVVRFLRAAGIGPVYGVSYGPPLASIELFADQLDALIRRVRAATGARDVMLVTHSMGGLVALAYLRRYGASSVRRWVAIGAPFAGSVHARGFVGVSLAQLRPGNAWLRALDPHAPPAGRRSCRSGRGTTRW